MLPFLAITTEGVHVAEVEKAPADFPRDSAPGSVSGAQPKLLVVKVDGKFRPDVDEEEIFRRWTICDDLVQQLVEKTVNRMREGRVENLDDYVNKLQQWLQSQDWEGWRVTLPEAKWMRNRIRTLVLEQEGLA